ncbi:hypothetical protein FT643_17435 [Ketobacter sp. MCCC 1A13808]|uniref:hypothetical protein n=1 Tax=Ketobacter sp. MCCC 1A13808 TaxID=2602738 RepID=UPI0012EC2578|nr:hypothetical protein [Ketobacter sp. MCCC 1A13808]MVF13925.1 hypothetical protein [Ketobacter sp. MCCC 1A13808]
MKNKVSLWRAITDSRSLPSTHILVICIVAFALFSPVYAIASAQEQGVTSSNAADSLDQLSTKVSPLTNAKISTLSFSQAVKLGIPLGVMIHPDAPDSFTDKAKPTKHDERLIENRKR